MNDNGGGALHWFFDYLGEWEAFSVMCGDGIPFRWAIGVCDDGTFSVSESDNELTDRKETFDTLKEAKAWCEEQEQKARREGGKHE
jgi:hypothetical protein